MAQWLERRGYTLRLPRAADAEGDTQFVRLSLVERLGLVSGLFNVREARAEPDRAGRGVQPVAGGRALSWRPLRRAEAERLLEARLDTLQAMGYGLVGTAVGQRGRWDWLYELVHRRLTHAESPDPPAATPDRGDALRDALTRIGLSPDAVIEGVAAVLGLTPDAFAEPHPESVRRVHADELAVVLPFLLRHDHAQIRAIGERWLRCPTLPYALPGPLLVQWLEVDPKVARTLGERLPDEGLAMLGPEALSRLARTGATDSVRDGARAWLGRLG